MIQLLRIAIFAAPVIALIPLNSIAAQDQLALEFGKNNGEFANDGECDDARFIGIGMAEILLTDSIGKDAADCKAAMKAGTIRINPLHAVPANDAAINFGDNASTFAKDGECDDIRFAGKGSAKMVYLFEDIGHDASDCKAAFAAGTVKWQGSSPTPELGVTAEEINRFVNQQQITT